MMNSNTGPVSRDHLFISLFLILVGLLFIVLNMPLKGINAFVALGTVLSVSGLVTSYRVFKASQMDNCASC